MKNIIHVHPDAESEVIDALENAPVELQWTSAVDKDCIVLPQTDE